MTGAAISTTGNMVAHDRSHALNHWAAKVPESKRDMLAIAAAMAQVNPDWMTLKTKCVYRVEIFSILSTRMQ
jgi:hypothetical protein